MMPISQERVTAVNRTNTLPEKRFPLIVNNALEALSDVGIFSKKQQRRFLVMARGMQSRGIPESEIVEVIYRKGIIQTELAGNNERFVSHPFFSGLCH